MPENGSTIIAFSVLGLFLAGYLGQKFLPPPKPTAIGIDLGTTYSCATAFLPGSGDILVFRDSKSGQTCIPSIVAFKSNGGALVGPDIETYRESKPGSIVYDAKRFIGRTVDKVEQLPFYNRYPFEVSIDTAGKAFFQVSVIDRPDEKLNIYPEQVSAAIVKRLVESAQSELNRPVNAVVMAVPAEFDDDQREATKAAAESTGVKVLRLLNEPTSAAIAYGIHEHRKHMKEENLDDSSKGHQGGIITSLVIVLDVGGGTTDVAVLAVRHPASHNAKSGTSFSTLSIAGSNRLGGQDFTNRLQALLADKLTGMGRAFAYTNEHLRAAAEECKILLTDKTEVTVDLGEDIVNVTRAEFERVNFDLFYRIPRIMSVAIEQASGGFILGDDDHQLEPKDIDDVILVGGSTRIPKIRKTVAEMFGGRMPRVDVDPELAVATGAAVQAGTIVGAWPLTVAAVDITPNAANRPKRVTVSGEE